MNSIVGLSKINRNELSELNYFESLIGTARSLQLIDSDLIEKIQLAILKLLADKCRQYTGGNSSSVRVEVSEELLKSILFTLGIWLKDFKNPDDAIKELNKKSIFEGYIIGLKKINTKIKSTKYFYKLTKDKMLSTDNYTYNSTLVEAIDGFFKLYNPEYFAHKIYITADYPTVIYPNNFQGIEFIQQYLSFWNCENRFCNSFDNTSLNNAITLFAINYGDTVKEMVFNIYIVTLSIALACAISDNNISMLSLSDKGKTIIKSLFNDNKLDKFSVFNAFVKLQKTLSFDKNALEYTYKTIDKSSTDIVKNILIFADYYD